MLFFGGFPPFLAWKNHGGEETKRHFDADQAVFPCREFCLIWDANRSGQGRISVLQVLSQGTHGCGLALLASPQTLGRVR